jgi:uncharacterized Fe-S cluster-containing protein
MTAVPSSPPASEPELPGLDCGLCGVRTCSEFAARIKTQPEWIDRCIHLSDARFAGSGTPLAETPCSSAGTALTQVTASSYHDTLGREFDFFLDRFPEDPGPREVILPHNPLLTREMELQRGDVLIGRPLGMSCGCPVTHCGVVTEVDPRTGVVVWCVTGPLKTRQEGFKDIGYYSAEAYEGLIVAARTEIRIGARYFFQPRLCMLQ